jgi:predicted dehydrogenase
MNSQDEKPTILAQLGCGYWGPNLLRSFSSSRKCHVKWLAELSPERRAYVEENFPRTKTTANWQEVFDDKEVDGVIIATPASTHFTLVKQALEADKHVFVEKPLAMCVKEADELVALAAARRKTLMVGHTFLYNNAVQYVRDLMERGELGQVFYFYSHRLNLGRVRSDLNAWWNLAPHDISILVYLMGGQLPKTVSARGMDYIQPGIEDVVFATLTWPSGVMAHIQTSWLDPGKVRKLTIVGSNKMVTYDDVSDDKIIIYNKGVDRVPSEKTPMPYDDFNKYQLIHRTGDVMIPKIDFKEPLKNESSHFIECLRNKSVPRTGPQHARDVVAVLEAGQKSLKSGLITEVQPNQRKRERSREDEISV